ncbi:MAG: DUF4157 domain-containing protein [Verrucomicrobia bacterium]|nr:DUF4157 domain-containing protein [Verrucomicrobiota bacterium]
MCAADSHARIHVDWSAAPECEAFARKSQAQCEEWYPRINELLNGKDAPLPYAEIFLKFAPMKGVAATSGNRITVSAEWVTRKATNDYGMVIHELTHIVQDYHGRGLGWLTEGIADYVRHRHFESGAWKPVINPEKDSYKQGYKSAAAFLMWLEGTKDKDIVRKLNTASRENKATPALFHELLGKELDELWSEFAATMKKPAR